MTDHPDTPDTPPEEEVQDGRGPVIRDKRRIDPETGMPRATAGEGAQSSPAGAGAAEEDAEAAADAPADGPSADAGQADHPDTALAAERLEEMRRMQAEFVNFRNRTQREREGDRDRAVAAVVEAMLPVMDDIHSAREHGDLVEGPFAAIAEKLESTLARFGVERVGEVGEEFDPTVHEALMHLPAEQADLPEGASGMTIVQVVQPGFRVNELVVRAARVAVADAG
ncbi:MULTISPECIES: nucleotide exchange factor GrpE [Ornithinimicrobium]|uniref:Protein GrpE n=1 Tax=Ornithinimicrobium kibberense TaxID=282060 RepID=A0ABV5V269_9MICO|nr:MULTISPECIES: nucleotide exchange factor GrpE [Ornithinimicrobium]OLT21476.1 nucleotide exchange factor GrpE [Ornithinimicrobium sp. CNJ-824]